MTLSTGASSAGPLKSKAATLAVVDPPRVPSFFESSSSPKDAVAAATKSLDRDDQMSQRMESVGSTSSGGSGVGGNNLSRQRPNSFNYMGARGGGVDMGLLKNQLRKTNSREMLAEREDGDHDDDDDGVEADEDNNGGHRRMTVEETRKSLEDLSAAATAEKESWKTKSCEHLLGGGKSKKKKKESKLPPGWTKQFDSVAGRDVYIFKEGVSGLRVV